MKIYISGRITGRVEQARTDFAYAEQKLKKLGHYPLNPFNFKDDHDKSWNEYMKVCIKELVDCDAILMLDGWIKSKGAKLEHAVASQLGLEIIFDVTHKIKYLSIQK